MSEKPVLKKMKTTIETVFLFYTSPFRKKITAMICGHRTKKRGVILSGSEGRIITLQLWGGRPEYCLSCINKMTIKCFLCNGPIFIGDLVTLHRPFSNGKEIPEHAIIHTLYKDQILLVGCARKSCRENKAIFIWTAPGEVQTYGYKNVQIGENLIRRINEKKKWKNGLEV